MTWIRVNILRTSATEVTEKLTAQGFTVQQSEFLPYALEVKGETQVAKTVEHQRGFFYIQSLASQMVAHVLNPQENDHVIDLCAAPGSKTTHLSMLLKNTGAILANDESFLRLRSLGANIDRMGCTNIAMVNYKGQFLRTTMTPDKVLVDAPCSGKGTRSPMDFSENRLSQLAKLQKKLIVRGFDLLKPGGILVYSTCTTTEKENEEVVDYLCGKRETAQMIKPSLPCKFEYNIGARISLDEKFFIACVKKGEAT